MAVEREKLFSGVPRMLQNNERAVILRNRVVRQDMHNSGKRRAHRRARFNEKVNSKMNGASLIGGILARRELCRVIQQSRFVVTPDRDTCAGFLQFFRNRRGKICSLALRRIRTEKRTSHAEVENDHRSGAKIQIENRSGARGRFSQIAFGCCRCCNWCKPARGSQRVIRKAGKNLRPSFESFPCRRFADRHVCVVRLQRFSQRRIHHAHRQPHSNQRVQQRNLFFVQRKFPLVSEDHTRSGRKNVFFPKNRVRNCRCQFRNCNSVVRITKIDHARNVRR